MMGITRGRIFTALGLAAAIALVAWSLMPSPVPVETAAVTQGRFVATVDEDGKTRVRERYVVAAPLAGRLTRIRLKAGDTVEADEAVAAILPSPAPFLDPRTREETQERLGAAEAARERSKALIERAKAQADQAKSDLARVRTLTERGAATAQALERAETALRVAERDLRAAEFQDDAAAHEIEQAKALLARYHDNGAAPPERWTVTAPLSGLVLKVTQESETIVQPGTPLLEIGDPRDLEIVVDVLSTDAVEIRPGAAVAIENWGGPGTLAGQVRRVEPAAFTKISTLGVEEQRVNVLIDFTSPPQQWAGLGDAYQLDTRITVFARDEAIVVPSGALFRIGDGWNVYVVKDGRAERRAVELLRRAGRFAAVTSGLAPGETVIVYPSDRIAPGVRVEAR
ncbi:MAG: efflux RND transporter periplasmic adaptor subunit [Pseudolabrys sp.]